MIQGIGEHGMPFGYDTSRRNFVVWGRRGDKVIVERVEHDDQESEHGSLRETEREARAIAARENRLPNGKLRRAVFSPVV
jgi:hypothetical protein